MTSYYFIAYSAQSVNTPSVPVFGNVILKISSSQPFVLLRELEKSLNDKNPKLNHVIINYKKITKKQYLLEMKTAHPKTTKVK